MNKHRVKAYTLMEITVAMLVSAIVISITYSAYSIVSRSYIAYKTKNDRLAVLERLDELLKRDFSHADSILKTDNGILVFSSGDSINYELDTAFVTRVSTIIDTFKVKTTDAVTSFENTPVTVSSPDKKQNRIDDLDFTLLFENEKIPYHYHKDYSSANLIERNPNAIH